MYIYLYVSSNLSVYVFESVGVRMCDLVDMWWVLNADNDAVVWYNGPTAAILKYLYFLVALFISY